MSSRFASLTFERTVTASVPVLWQVWTAPAARALWAAPVPDVEVVFLEADTRPGGHEVSLCRVAGKSDIRCEIGWLEIQPEVRTVNYETVSSEGAPLASALVTAEFTGADDGSRILVTVQLSAAAEQMEDGYRQGFGQGMNHLADVAARTMVLQRMIGAPRTAVWNAWLNPETLPQWWGPDGFSCRTKRIDLRDGGEWVFNMIAADGTVYPNHHRYREVRERERMSYTLLWGENGPKHADAWASFEETAGGTRVTLAMVFASVEECRQARGFGAEALGMQTLGKLARFVGAD
ncbi:SRPBCC domain-containing protein [Alsobacter sp. R-9]